MAPATIATRWRKIFCALVLSTILLVTLHGHAYLDPQEGQPIAGGHHCLLCIAAHLPSAMSKTSVAPLPPASSSLALFASEKQLRRDIRIAFSLYMRPPPSV